LCIGDRPATGFRRPALTPPALSRQDLGPNQDVAPKVSRQRRGCVGAHFGADAVDLWFCRQCSLNLRFVRRHSRSHCFCALHLQSSKRDSKKNHAACSKSAHVLAHPRRSDDDGDRRGGSSLHVRRGSLCFLLGRVLYRGCCSHVDSWLQYRICRQWCTACWCGRLHFWLLGGRSSCRRMRRVPSDALTMPSHDAGRKVPHGLISPPLVVPEL